MALGEARIVVGRRVSTLMIAVRLGATAAREIGTKIFRPPKAVRAVYDQPRSLMTLSRPQSFIEIGLSVLTPVALSPTSRRRVQRYPVRARSGGVDDMSIWMML